ncbi:MAG: tRNA (guanosine(46)-N7)-methyltransferase TrmB [Lachnospiraceae bacterium]|nr:tRNA (guanosine(46)-N7)-methyltransferase TrmB [Lachnospiraceae bacterium]
MRLRNVPGSEDFIAKSPYVCTEPNKYQGKWNSYFGNDNPVHIEIGMGKGQFITEMARLNPDVNYIGIEMYSSVMHRAVKKLEQMTVRFNNLALLCMDARRLSDVFANDEVMRIYLNFSDPWPKARHARRRITSRNFLAIYDNILDKDGHIEFKTDNQSLFTFSLEELEAAGWRTGAVSHDLHNDVMMCSGNVMTEYEEKFSALGNLIYKYVICR